MSATCQTCGGTGWIEAGWVGTPPDPSERERECPDCDGSGIIVEPQDDWAGEQE